MCLIIVFNQLFELNGLLSYLGRRFGRGFSVSFWFWNIFLLCIYILVIVLLIVFYLFICLLKNIFVFLNFIIEKCKL